MLDNLRLPNIAPADRDKFERMYSSKFEPFNRVALLLGLTVSVGLFGLDYVTFEQSLAEVTLIRSLTSVAIAVLLFAHRSPLFARHQADLMMAAVISTGAGTIAMTRIHEPEAVEYYAGLLLLTLVSFSIIRMGFWRVVLSTVSLNVAFAAVAASSRGAPDSESFRGLVFLTTGNLVGIIGAWFVERQIRENFLQQITIEKRSADLEARNVELSLLNQDLAQQRRSAADSRREAEVAFNAFNSSLHGSMFDGKFEIGAQLGSGGFGTVYRAKHRVLGTVVALKIFRPAGDADPRYVERFHAEAMSINVIAHPNIVRVVDADITPAGVPYIAMEYLEGLTVMQRLRKPGAWPAAEVVSHLADIADALAALHAAGLVHRDVKPGNIMLAETPQGLTAKLLDFGIAKFVDSAHSAGEPSTLGGISGTPAYIAPERFGPGGYDGRSDVYSLAVVLYECLSGTMPFAPSEGGIASMFLRQLTWEPPTLAALGVSVPAELSSLVARGMVKEPERRPDSRVFSMVLRGVAERMRSETKRSSPISEPVRLASKNGNAL